MDLTDSVRSSTGLALNDTEEGVNSQDTSGEEDSTDDFVSINTINFNNNDTRVSFNSATGNRIVAHGKVDKLSNKAATDDSCAPPTVMTNYIRNERQNMTLDNDKVNGRNYVTSPIFEDVNNGRAGNPINAEGDGTGTDSNEAILQILFIMMIFIVDYADCRMK